MNREQERRPTPPWVFAGAAGGVAVALIGLISAIGWWWAGRG